MDLTPPSTPPSPSSPLAPTTSNNALSDIFSDSPPTSPTFAPTRGFSEPSDLSRLRPKHVNEGYRDGITASKNRSLQPGVDEGWPLGATFALRVWCLLGALEGVWGAYEKDAKAYLEERRRLGKLAGEAREELSIEGIFGKDWWGEDGVWRYKVVGKEEEVTFQEVVDAHPLVRKWEGVVGEEAERAGVRVGVFEGEEWESGRVGDAAAGDGEKGQG